MRAYAFASLCTMTTLGWLFFACGGGQPADSPSGSSSSGPGAMSSAGPAGSSPDTSSPSTTLAVDPAESGTKLNPSNAPSSASAAPAGSSDPGKKKGEPGRTQDDIRVIIQAHRDEARACYDAALATHPDIEGDVTIGFTIDPEGNPTNVAADPQRTTLFEPSVGTCISEVIKKLKFSRSLKGMETHAHYPFNFHPRANSRNRDAG